MSEIGESILLEPIANLSASATPLKRFIGKLGSHIGQTSSSYRLDHARLNAALENSGVQIVSDEVVLDGRYRLIRFQASR